MIRGCALFCTIYDMLRGMKHLSFAILAAALGAFPAAATENPFVNFNERMLPRRSSLP